MQSLLVNFALGSEHCTYKNHENSIKFHLRLSDVYAPLFFAHLEFSVLCPFLNILVYSSTTYDCPPQGETNCFLEVVCKNLFHPLSNIVFCSISFFFPMRISHSIWRVLKKWIEERSQSVRLLLALRFWYLVFLTCLHAQKLIFLRKRERRLL